MKRLIVLIFQLVLLWLLAWPISFIALASLTSERNPAGQLKPDGWTVLIPLAGAIIATVFVVRRVFPKRKQAELIGLSVDGRSSLVVAHTLTFREKFLGPSRRVREEQAKAAQARRLSEMETEERSKLEALIRDHRRALIRNWHRFVETDDYGTRNYSRWKEEIAHFFSSRQHVPLLLSFDQSYRIVTEDVESVLNERDFTSSQSTTNPYEFERRCAEDLIQAGWNARLTSATGDQGVDIIAEKNHVIVVVQCKLYSGPVGNKAVQEAIGGKEYEKADFAAVVAPNGFTRSAQELARRANVVLLSDKHVSLLEHFIQ